LLTLLHKIIWEGGKRMEWKGRDGKYAKVSFPFTPQFGGEINSSFEG
jgi:hypothetical protein